jgi:hypothetical protein
MGWTAGVRFPSGTRTFLFAIMFRPALRPTQSPFQLVDLSAAPLPGVKRQERQTEQTSPTNADVKKVWSYTISPSYIAVASCVINLLKPKLV